MVTDWLGGQATYGYDQDGRLATFTHFNGIATSYTYDAASRLTGIGSVVASYQFTLDGNGNRINSAQTEPLAPAYSLGSTTYGYNAQQNRLLSAGPLSYAYDNEGQLANAAGTGLTFDYNHRLVAIGTDTQFSYDGRGNRLIATRAGVTTHYIYDPWGNLVADADSNGVTHKYIYGKGLLAIVTSSARYCYHFNGTGSTVAITDMTQNVVNSYAYDPFGQILGQQETVPQPFKYVGQYGVMAEPNGLYYMRARYYDPTVGRFISEDPLGFGGGDVNLFAYVQNNPVSLIDPIGKLYMAAAAPLAGYVAMFPPYGELAAAGIMAGAGALDLYNLMEGWMSPEEAARQRANDILKENKNACSGKGDRSGRSGDPYNAAARQLQEIAKDNTLLPEYRDELLSKAQDFLMKARELNHPGR